MDKIWTGSFMAHETEYKRFENCTMHAISYRSSQLNAANQPTDRTQSSAEWIVDSEF